MASGEGGHIASEYSVPKNIECEWCHSFGHKATICLKKFYRQKGRQPKVKVAASDQTTAKQQSSEESEEEEEASTRRVQATSITALCKGCSDAASPTPPFSLQIRCKPFKSKKTIRAISDTGATITVIEQLGMAVRRTTTKLYNALDAEMTCVGKVTFWANARAGKSVKGLVSRDLHNEMLVSWVDLINLGILPASFPDVIEDSTKAAEAPVARVATKPVHIPGARAKWIDHFALKQKTHLKSNSFL